MPDLLLHVLLHSLIVHQLWLIYNMLDYSGDSDFILIMVRLVGFGEGIFRYLEIARGYNHHF